MSDKSFEFEMLDKDEQFIQGAMRDNGWSRDQAEQVYFKNLTENTKFDVDLFSVSCHFSESLPS